ncbi:hypothetical protein [Dokdonella soli]|uniref:Portal protein n=1 Tax=Dokdonella soli TaxID=529810 RepID=A0ABN1IUF3_9GAMM
MSPTLENFRAESAFDPPGPAADDIPSQESQHPLDDAESAKVLGYIDALYREAHEAGAENRREQMIDADFYDHIQWTLEDSTILMNRGQAPLTFNLIKPAVDWVIGTERRTRVDWKVYGRNPGDDEGARAKMALLKYLSDVNGVPWERSRQFRDACIVGVGWTEEGIRADGDGEAVQVRYVDWKEMTWDPYSRRNDLEDCRALHRERWVDEDYACAMFPDRQDKIRTSSVNAFDTDSLSMMEDWNGLPMVFTNLDRFGRMTRYGHLIGTTASSRRSRKRIRLIETWYRRPISVKKMFSANESGDEWDATIYDPNNAEHVSAVAKKYVTLTNAVQQEMWCAIWVHGALLQNMKSPYKHGRYPFTPDFAYRRHRDGMPYGIVRGARDPQEEYNKRRSKALFILSTNRVIYEESAIEMANEDDVLEQVARPNGQIRLNDGALKDNRFRIENDVNLAEAHVKLMQSSEEMVFQVSGITRENMGSDSSATSGRAIIAKQQQGAVSTAELFDNFRQAFQLSGQKVLSLTEQYMPMPKQIRILGSGGNADYMTLNNPVWNEQTGKWAFENDITKTEGDFIVDQQDYRETVRQAMAESLFDLLSKIDPNMAVQLLDLAVDMTDIPNKDELVKRIRSINGQTMPGEPLDPQTQQQLAKKAQDAEEARVAALSKTQSEATRNNAAAAKDQAMAGKEQASAAKIGVEGQQTALTTAGQVAGAPHLAAAADKLYQEGGIKPRRPPPPATPPYQLGDTHADAGNFNPAPGSLGGT